MKKTPKRGQPSRKARVWISILGIACLGLLIWFAVNAILIAQDRARFAEVSKEKSLIASKLVATLGDNVIFTREQDECFNAEQGPWDNGRLWCQVATVINLKRDIGYDAVGEEYFSIGTSMGLDKSNIVTTLPDFSLHNSSGVRCDLELQGSDGSTKGNPARSLFKSLTQRISSSAIAIACADRARAAYYPYTE